MTTTPTPQPTFTTSPPEGGGGGIGDIVNGIGDAINGAVGAVNYWSDPWGNTFKALQDAASGMAHDILPALTGAVLPDLNAEWFLNLYAVSFAAAILVAVVLIIPQVVGTARGTLSGRDLLESIGLYFPLFLAGAMFGPLVGIMLVEFFHALTDVFAQAGIVGAIDTTTSQLQSMIDNTDPAGVTGGVPIAALLMLLMVIALFLVLLVFLVQLVTLYFTGVLFPLGLVWIISKNRRSFGSKLAWLWLGLLAAHPLMFLLLGVAFSMMANSVGTFGNNLSLQSFVTLIVALIAMFMAALSPLLLMKFAPVVPAAPAVSGPNLPGGGSDKQIGPSNVTDATNRYGRGGESEPSTSSTTSTTSSSETSEESDSLSTISASRAGSVGESAAGAGAGASEGVSGAAEGVGATSAGAGAAGGATAAEGAAVAAGTAESSTGVGAVIGVPTLLAAGAAAAAEKAKDLTDEAGGMATEPMNESTIGQDKL